MAEQPSKRFIFLGGIPVFDYMITVRMEEIARATGNKVVTVGDRILLPVGTVFRVWVEGLEKTVYINPMANREVQHLHDEPYYSLELGGKHPEQYAYTLCSDDVCAFDEVHASFPEAVPEPAALKVVEVAEPARIRLGGNNKNIVEEIRTLYASPELEDCCRNFSFEHLFFFDAANPKYRLVEEIYGKLGISMGEREAIHVAGLSPRIGYVFTLVGDQGEPLDRVILSNRTNEEIIPAEQLSQRYFDLEYKLRRDQHFVETHLVVNSMTNPEELRLALRVLQTAFASGVTGYLCPTLTFLKCVDRLIDSRFYAVEKERFYEYRKDVLDTALLPYVRYLILNREELGQVDNAVSKKGIDTTAATVAQQMNRGRHGDSVEGGRVVVTGGSKGVRFTERLRPERATLFWRKAGLPEGRNVRYADRRLVCGDDYVTDLVSTLGAGDVFTGIFIGLTALGWDGGHAIRAATLGAQHFIQHREKPGIRQMVEMDEAHIRLGTETVLGDVISHHVDDTGDPTRYGTIADTVITIHTTQIHHPFREILELAKGFTRRDTENR